MKILIIDDDVQIRKFLSEVVHLTHRFHILYAETQERAIHVAKQENPELILLDIYLPDCDDLSTLRKLRKVTPNALIIIISSDRDNIDMIVESIKLGAHDYIGKPFAIQQLNHKLDKALIILEQQKTINKLLDLLEQNGKNVNLLKPRHP